MRINCPKSQFRAAVLAALRAADARRLVWAVSTAVLLLTATGTTVPAAAQSTIIIEKQAVGGDGVTAFEFSGPNGPFTLQPTLANPVVSETFSLIDGEYEFSETQVAGWSLSINCNAGASVDIRGSGVTILLGIGETVTCRFVNTKVAPPTRIIIEKKTVNGDGTTDFHFVLSDGSQSFLFTLTPPTDDPVSVTSPALPAGTYTIAEVNASGWTTTIACNDSDSGPLSGAPNPTANIILDAGETVKCTFTNARAAHGTIIIEKQSVNGIAGTSFQFSGSEPIGGFALAPPADGSASSTFPVPSGTYTVTETAIQGWGTTISCNDPDSTASGLTATIRVGAGETVTCRFVNSRGSPGKVTIVKQTVNATSAETFGFTVAGPGISTNFSLTPPANGTAQSGLNSVPPGIYTVAEHAVAGWTTSIQCTDAIGNNSGPIAGAQNPTAEINVSPGDDVTCTFVNTKSGPPAGTGKIIIEKRIFNGDGTSVFEFTASPGLGTFTLQPPAGNNPDTKEFANLPDGEYEVNETPVAGWSTDVQCTDPSGGSERDPNSEGRTAIISILSGETVTCTFVNTKQIVPTRIIIEKEAVNGDGITDFDFVLGENGPTGGELGNFTLRPNLNEVASETSQELAPGSYYVTETPVPGWSTTIQCTDPSGNSGPASGAGSPTANIELAQGETVTCRFKNTRDTIVPGRIIIEKETVGGSGPASFEFTGSLGDFTINAPAAGVVSQDFPGLTNATYSVTETAVSGWSTKVSCNDPTNNSVISGATAIIDLRAGETVTCRFVNTRQASGRIIIEKETVNGTAPTTFQFTGTVGSFTIAAPASGTASHVIDDVVPGSHSVAETPVSGWSASVFCTDPTGDSSQDGTDPAALIKVAPGETVTCRFINVLQTGAATVIIQKEAVNGDGGTTFDFTCCDVTTSNVVASLTPPSGGMLQQTLANVTAPGTYRVTEIQAGGWALSSVQCSDPSSDSRQDDPAHPSALINVAAGETVVCRFVNTRQQGTIVIEKQTVNGDGTTSFHFEEEHSRIAPFSLTPASDAVVASQSILVSTDEAAYDIFEVVPEGWTASVQCDKPSVPTSGGNFASILPAPGETVTCRFVNTRTIAGTGSLTIAKHAVSGNGTFAFTSSNAALPSFSLTTTSGEAQHVNGSLPPGTYVITEEVTSGWTLTGIGCGAGANASGDLATRSVTVVLAAGENVECKFTNAPDVVATGSITIIKRTLGGDGTFSFSSSNGALASFSLTTTAGQAMQTNASLATGTYVISEQVASGWSLSSVACEGGASAAGNLEAKSATINLGAGESVICTFVNTEVAKRTQTIIENFLGHRADLLTVDDGGPRLIERQRGGASGSPFHFAGNGDDAAGRLSFGFSLNAMLAANARKDAKRARVGSSGSGSSRGSDARPGLDIWLEGIYSYYRSDDDAWAGTSGHFGIVRFGADYLFSGNFLGGIMVQFDTMDETSNAGGYSVDGFGWMAGPYAEARFGENIFIDVKALWGQSSNDISPFKTYTDTFDTERWLASARITGLWTYEGWRFTPSARVLGFSDASDGYVDSLGNTIDGMSASIGRATFGPQVAYRYVVDEEWLIEPSFGIEGIWTFAGADADGFGAGIDPIRARLEGGLKIEALDGTRFEIEATYDGLGTTTLDAISGKASMTMPLN